MQSVVIEALLRVLDGFGLDTQAKLLALSSLAEEIKSTPRDEVTVDSLIPMENDYRLELIKTLPLLTLQVLFLALFPNGRPANMDQITLEFSINSACQRKKAER